MKNVVFAVAAAVSLAGCGMLEAEAKSRSLCVRQDNVADVPAAPQVSVPSTPVVELRLDVGAVLPDLDEEGVEVDLLADAITLGSASGDVSFSGVESATVAVLPPPGRAELAPVVFRYSRATPAPAEIFELRAMPERGADLADYVDVDALRIGVSFSGTAPPRRWTATLELCGETRAEVDYWERI